MVWLSETTLRLALKADNYSPLQNGISNEFSQSISYVEIKPNAQLESTVHCLWSLKTLSQLNTDFFYTVMPDACIDIIFAIADESKPILMTPHMHIENLKLGQVFHYVGIRLRPGVVTNAALDITSVVGGQKKTDRIAHLNLDDSYFKLRNMENDDDRYEALEELAHTMQTSGIIKRNILIENIINQMQLDLPIDVIAKNVGYSTRQLRRKVLEQTGFSPMQLHRVLRF